MDYKQAFKEASEKLPRKRLVKCACDCALINIDLIKPHTEKFDLIKSFLTNPKIADAAYAYAAAEAYSYASAAAGAEDFSYDPNYFAAYAVFAASTYAAFTTSDYEAAAFGVSYAAKVSEESKQKVDKLIKNMLSEVR